LAVKGDFGYTLANLGLEDCPRVRTACFDTTFDLERQRQVLLASYLPEPGQEEFLPATAGLLSSLASALGRRMLVLCTSRDQARALARLLEERGATSGKILLQEEGSDRDELTRRFRAGSEGILLGLASFWEGVDLPGELLEVLVVLKLPFLVPQDPVVQARSRRIRASGGDPFRDLFLPDATLKLKQGFGRLIRSSRDRGVVIVLDARLGTRNYSRSVWEAVSPSYRECGSEEEVLGAARAALEGEVEDRGQAR